MEKEPCKSYHVMMSPQNDKITLVSKQYAHAFYRQFLFFFQLYRRFLSDLQKGVLSAFMNRETLNIAIVDDQAQDASSLHRLISNYALYNSLDLHIAEFRSAEEFFHDYQPYAFSIVFMDIYMNELTGIDAAKKIRKNDRDIFIIFLTTSSEHMREAFSTHAFDYIEKPIEESRLFSVLDDILDRHTSKVNEPSLRFSSNRSDYMLPFKDIMLIRTAERNYLEITDINSTSYKTRMTFKEVSGLINTINYFLEINRGISVNLNYVTGIKNGICSMKGGTLAPVNLSKQAEIEQIWINFKFSKIRASHKGLIKQKTREKCKK